MHCPDGHVSAIVDLDDDPLERHEYELALAIARRERLIQPSKRVKAFETEPTRAGDAPRRARTLHELWLHIEEHPCPKCGTPQSASALEESERRADGRIFETHAGSCRNWGDAGAALRPDVRPEYEPSPWAAAN